MQKAPIHQSHVYRRIKISRTSFDKDHAPKEHSCEIISKSDHWFQKRLRISSCLYSAKSHHSPDPCLQTHQNFANIFWKGSSKEQSCEIISNSDQRSLRRKIWKNFSKSTVCKKSPPPTAAIFFNESKFHKQFLKRVNQGKILWNYFKIWPAVSERKNFEEFLLSLHRAKNLPPNGGHVLWIKILWTVFKKGHTRNILVKLFQILTSGFFKEFLQVNTVQKASFPPPPPHGSIVFRQIKIWRTSFEKGHKRNNPVKSFQNQTWIFREEDS